MGQDQVTAQIEIADEIDEIDEMKLKSLELDSEVGQLVLTPNLLKYHCFIV